MRYNKILFGIVMLLLMVGLSNALTYSLADDEFGNIRYGSVQYNSAISIGTSENRTACIPFVAGTTGYFDSFELHFDSMNSAYVLWWIDNEIVLDWDDADIRGYWNGSPEYEFETDELLSYENQYMNMGEFYWFCVQAPDTNSNAIAGYGINDYRVGQYPDYRMVSSATPLFEASHNPLLIVHSNGTVYNSSIQYHDIGAGQVVYGTADEVVASFQICYRPTFFSSESDCYSYSSYEGSQHYFGLDTEGATQWVGQYFTYTFDDGYSDYIDLYLFGATGTSGAETLSFRLWTLDADTFPSKQILAQSTGVSLSSIAQTNATTLRINFIPSVHFEEDKHYMFEVSCDSGCTGGTDKYVLTKGYLYSTSYTKEGFQDEEGFAFKNNSGSITNLTVDTNFILHFTTDVVPEDEGLGNLSNCSTTCSDWSGSYYLKEDFDGDISQCDWAVNTLYCWLGEVVFDKTYPFYSIFKLTDLKYSTDSRYYTVSFDIRPADIDSDGYLSLSLYDYDYVRYINVLFGADSKFYNNEEGNAVLKYSNMTTGSSKTMQLHVDLTDDDFDVYYDGSKILSGLQFTNSFLNIDSIYGIRISSQEAGYNIDNLEIYASNQDNVKTVVDEGVTPPTADPTKAWCELFNKETTTCSLDSECDSGECLPNGKCSSFDFTYCDENGHTRGSFCMISAMTSCVLTSTGDLILDNFFLFLIMLVIIMGLVYLSIMLRN